MIYDLTPRQRVRVKNSHTEALRHVCVYSAFSATGFLAAMPNGDVFTYEASAKLDCGSFKTVSCSLARHVVEMFLRYTGHFKQGFAGFCAVGHASVFVYTK